MLVAKSISHQVVTTDGGNLLILDDIHLNITKGESVAIVGASGSGKSTLLSMVAGLDSPSAGKIFIDKHEITSLTEEKRAEIRQRYVAFVFQNFQLLNGLNAVENVALPLEVKGDREATKKAYGVLDRVGLAERCRHMPNQLSGGEQQRVALARAFACEASIIFADEPTGNLDRKTGNMVADLLFDMNKERATTLVLVTHSPALAERCDKVYTMDAGKLMENRHA